MNILKIKLRSFDYGTFRSKTEPHGFTKCSPKVSPGIAIFSSVLSASIVNYGLLAKTLNLTPPELMGKPG